MEFLSLCFPEAADKHKDEFANTDDASEVPAELSPKSGTGAAAAADVAAAALLAAPVAAPSPAAPPAAPPATSGA